MGIGSLAAIHGVEWRQAGRHRFRRPAHCSQHESPRSRSIASAGDPDAVVRLDVGAVEQLSGEDQLLVSALELATALPALAEEGQRSRPRARTSDRPRR